MRTASVLELSALIAAAVSAFLASGIPLWLTRGRTTTARPLAPSRGIAAMCFSESIIMHATPERAFAYLADPATAPIIDPAVISYEPDSLPMRAGTTNTIRVRMYGIPATMRSRTLEWEEGRRMVLESIEPAQPVRARATHLFESLPEGVRYTWSMEMVSSGFGGRLAARLMTLLMRRNARRQQARFKRAIEAEQ